MIDHGAPAGQPARHTSSTPPATRGRSGFRSGFRPGFRSGGFTIIDVLVSMAVVAVLIGIMLPSLSRVRDATRRVICGSNLRQVGLGLHTYGNDSRGEMPWSVFVQRVGNNKAFESDPSALISLRLNQVPAGTRRAHGAGWDGLGLLFVNDYLPTGGIFYCPSHRAGEDFEKYAAEFRADRGDIIGNFQYRGEGPNGRRDLFDFDSQDAIASDSFGLLGWLNHTDGMNVLRAGNSVDWDRDRFNAITDSFGVIGTPAPDGNPAIQDAWRMLDGQTGPGAED